MDNFLGMHERLRHIEELVEGTNEDSFRYLQLGDKAMKIDRNGLRDALIIFRWILEGEL